ncbi:MAG: hypothetical protein C4336_00880 [Armatimonadota bacterium]
MQAPSFSYGVVDYSGIVQSVFIIGWETGGFLFGIVGDRLGRTCTMALTILRYAGFTGLSAFAQSWEQFARLRFLVGLGVRGEFAAGAALVAETFPALFRDIRWRRHTLVGVGLAAVGVVGFWGIIGTWSPDLLTQALNPTGDPQLKELVEARKSYVVRAQQVGAFFGMLSWAYLAQRIGRRCTFALTFLACLAIVPASFFLTTSHERAPLLGFFTTALFASYAVYFPELFPTRATGVGFCYNVARYIAAVAPFTFGVLSAQFGIAWAAPLISTVSVLGLMVLYFAPETHGKPLPEG